MGEYYQVSGMPIRFFYHVCDCEQPLRKSAYAGVGFQQHLSYTTLPLFMTETLLIHGGGKKLPHAW